MKKANFVFAILLVFLVSASGFKKPTTPRYIELVDSQSVTMQESIGTGALNSPRLVVNVTKPTITIQFDTIIKCGSSANGAARNFNVYIRVDGVVVRSIPVSVADNGTDYRYQVISTNVTVNGMTNGAHVVDVYVDAGGEMVVIFSSTASPTTLSVTQM